MDVFLRDAVSTVLASTLNELIVLSHGKHLRSSTRTRIAEENPTKPNKKSGNLENGKGNLPIATLNEIKLNNDLKKLIDIYTKTMDELQNSGTIKVLLETINQQIAENKEQQKIIQEHNESTSILKSLNTRLTEFKSEAEGKLLRASEKLNLLKSDWRVITKVNELEHELVKKWEDTRYTQAVIFSENQEEKLKESYSMLVFKTNAEERVIFDVQAFSKRQFEEYESMIEMWKEKYSRELSVLLSDIKEKEDKIKEVDKIYNKHYEIYNNRKLFINEYLEQKAEQNRLRQLEIQRIDSAVKIQAWWRGLMVRRGLGPFRKISKKGKKGKKGK